jgi:hypothetical protein
MTVWQQLRSGLAGAVPAAPGAVVVVSGAVVVVAAGEVVAVARTVASRVRVWPTVNCSSKKATAYVPVAASDQLTAPRSPPRFQRPTPGS